MKNVVNRALAAKKKFITLLLLAITMSAFAEDHLKFMGIPINGQLTTFCQQLEKKNFKLEKAHADRARYEGSFTGKTVCVIVEATPKTHTVCDVLVAYKDNRTWEEMEDLYSGLKEQLTAKYDEPVEWHQLGDAPKNASFMDIQRKLADAELTRRAIFRSRAVSTTSGQSCLSSMPTLRLVARCLRQRTSVGALWLRWRPRRTILRRSRPAWL